MRLSFTGFLKETAAPQSLPGYGKAVKGDDGHYTYTCLKDKKEQILIDVPGKEWHQMVSGKVTKVGSMNDDSLNKHLKEAFKPLKTGAAEILPGQSNMFAMKDDVDPTLSGQAHDDNREEYDPTHKNHPEHSKLTGKGYEYSGSYNARGVRVHTYYHTSTGKSRALEYNPKTKQHRPATGFDEDFMSTQIPISHGKVNSEDASNGYTFPQDQVSDVDDHERKREDSLSRADGGSSDQGFGGRTECLDIVSERKIQKCPKCGSKDYSLMPTDFETAKCNQCGKNWNHGVNEMADYAQGLGATDSQYSGSVEKNKMVEKKRVMNTTAANDYIGGMGGTVNLPDAG
jgi:hypothetical protein